MIDWDFETRLVDRIAARELIATRLSPRQRRVLAGYYRFGETLKEVGKYEGISTARAQQILNGAECRLTTAPVDKPAPTTRATPPPGFDKAAFLRHMQGLMARRETEARETFERERAELDDLIASEQPVLSPPKPPPPPPKVVWPPPPPLKAPLLPPVYYVPALPKPPQVQAVESWFDPARMPTLEGLRQIARYALDFLVLMRQAALGPLGPGLRREGTRARRIICRRDADAIATEVGSFARELPHQAQLSAVPFPVPAEWLCVKLASSFAALRVNSVHDGQDVMIDISWDPCPSA